MFSLYNNVSTVNKLCWFKKSMSIVFLPLSSWSQGSKYPIHSQGQNEKAHCSVSVSFHQKIKISSRILQGNFLFLGLFGQKEGILRASKNAERVRIGLS